MPRCSDRHVITPRDSCSWLRTGLAPRAHTCLPSQYDQGVLTTLLERNRHPISDKATATSGDNRTQPLSALQTLLTNRMPALYPVPPLPYDDNCPPYQDAIRGTTEPRCKCLNPGYFKWKEIQWNQKGIPSFHPRLETQLAIEHNQSRHNFEPSRKRREFCEACLGLAQ